MIQPLKSTTADPCEVVQTLDGFAVVDARGHTLAIRESRRSAAYAAMQLNGAGEHAAVNLPQRPQEHERPLTQAADLWDDPELLSLHSES
jgi:hypothetical protein